MNADTIVVGINGFGRIGKLLVRAVLQNSHLKIKIKAINDPFTSPEHIAYLLKHDSVHGHLQDLSIGSIGTDYITVNGQKISISSFADASLIPWAKMGIEVVAETSGCYTNMLKAQCHLTAGAKKVVISAPPEDDSVPTFVFGVNHHLYDDATMDIISNASCTTNCLAPLARIVHETFGIKEGIMTTIHAVTGSQRTVDGVGEKNWRAGRSSMQNIIPTATGAAVAVQKVLPQLCGRLTGMAFRVPVADVSVLDLTCTLERPISSLRELSNAINGTQESDLSRIIGVTTDQVVSSDFIGDSRSCIYDEKASIILNPTFVKLVAYYDNEWAYALRMVDLITYITSTGKKSRTSILG